MLRKLKRLRPVALVLGLSACGGLVSRKDLAPAIGSTKQMAKLSKRHWV